MWYTGMESIFIGQNTVGHRYLANSLSFLPEFKVENQLLTRISGRSNHNRKIPEGIDLLEPDL